TLQSMQEESRMVEPETLMRYIRVFSELSGQIRYSSQKRVLVEIALIKLCRPAMETNMDSILDRLRVLEEKMENGIPAAVSAAPAPVPADSTVSSAPSAAAKQSEPAKAAPEDLKKVRAQWRSIVGTTEGMFKQFLNTAV